MTPLLNSAGAPLYVLRRISDKFVINPRAISNSLGLPVPGDDQEYLPIVTDPRPDFDPDFTTLLTVESPNETNHTWEISITVQDRPKAEVLALAANVARQRVQDVVPINDFTQNVILTLAAILRSSQGLALTPEEQGYADAIVAQAELLTNNKQNLSDIEAAISAGNKPDLSAGWAVADVSAGTLPAVP